MFHYRQFSGIILPRHGSSMQYRVQGRHPPLVFVVEVLGDASSNCVCSATPPMQHAIRLWCHAMCAYHVPPAHRM